MSFIDEHRSRFGVEPICRTLEWCVSSYYARKKRPMSARQQADEALMPVIRKVHADNYEAYGARRVWKELGRRGMRVGRCRVERLMRQHAIQGAMPVGRRRRTTIAGEAATRPADLVERHFVADAPNRLWVCDLTYLKTLEGFVYLAFVKDVFSRFICGFQLADHLRTDLVLDALEMAAHLRRAGADSGLIHHSDRGSQYTSMRYTQRLEDLAIAPSVGSVGDAYDNAMAESFVSSLKRELIKGRVFASRFEAEISVVEYLGWFNHTRLHGELGDVPPAEFEALWRLSDANANELRPPPQQLPRPTSVAGLYAVTGRQTTTI
jgi:transposase InsO family protein